MKKYLITGGTGFIGRSLTRSLVLAGHKVRVMDNELRGNISTLGDIRREFEFIKGDIRNPIAVRKACREIDCVVHLAAINGTKFFYLKPEEVLDVSIRGMINVIDSCLWHGVEELFFASSSEVYHNPKIVPTPENVEMVIPDGTNPRYSYAGGKIISELLLTNYGRKFFKRAVIFRPHNVYGPEMGWEHVIPQFILRMKKLALKKGDTLNFPIQGKGNETRSFVYIDDFVDGFNILLSKGKHLEIYNIGTSEEVPIKIVASEVARFFKRKIIIIPGKLAEGGTPRRLPDISKISKLGYKPKMTLAEGIQITARWYNENAHKIPATELP